MPDNLKDVLSKALKIVAFVKSLPFKARSLFPLCKEIWLSEEKLLTIAKCCQDEEFLWLNLTIRTFLNVDKPNCSTN